MFLYLLLHEKNVKKWQVKKMYAMNCDQVAGTDFLLSNIAFQKWMHEGFHNYDIEFPTLFIRNGLHGEL